MFREELADLDLGWEHDSLDFLGLRPVFNVGGGRKR